MTLPELTPNTKRKIERFKQKRLKVLQGITFTDLLSGRFFLSGELTTIHDLVYHRLDEHFSNITSTIFDELRAQLPETKQIGYLTSDPVFDSEWDKQLNKFIVEFCKRFTIDGRINWQKLSEIPSQ